MDLKGQIRASQIAESRFPVGGKIASINVKLLQTVKKGVLLATLDKSSLQTFLDRSLMQYEKERADFDEKSKTNLSEFDKRKTQNELDITVKNVEIAKQNLEETNLYCPISGIVAAIEGGLVGENITPARFTITVVDPNSLYFEAEIAQEKLSLITIGGTANVVLEGVEKQIAASIESIQYLPLRSGIYPIRLTLEDKNDLRLGFLGKAIFS